MPIRGLARPMAADRRDGLFDLCCESLHDYSSSSTSPGANSESSSSSSTAPRRHRRNRRQIRRRNLPRSRRRNRRRNRRHRTHRCLHLRRRPRLPEPKEAATACCRTGLSWRNLRESMEVGGWWTWDLSLEENGNGKSRMPNCDDCHGGLSTMARENPRTLLPPTG